MTERDPETLAEAIREQDRVERDADIKDELETTKKLADELASRRDESGPGVIE